MRHQLKLAWHHKRIVSRKLTHEQFVHEVASLGIAQLKQDEARQAQSIKLTYGAGGIPGARGVTYFNRWVNDKAEQEHFVEICANGEQNPVQLAGTTLHELGHVLAGPNAGHGKDWHLACHRLGLRAIRAAGTSYMLGMFAPSIRAQVVALIGRLNDGNPNNGLYGMSGLNLTGLLGIRPCSAGIGTRGGKSRGIGSGSRLRKYTCAACGQILRAGTDELQAHHDPDGGAFVLNA